jgi:uncharacterized membrane protein (DUF485 family)
MPNNDNKRLEKSALILFGIFWVIIGIQTLFKPIYYFRGAYVDFTGCNIQVGIGLILIGFVFIAVYFRKGHKKR